MAGRTVLVAGASGVVGQAAVQRFRAEGDEVIALSRRPPVELAGARALSVDLTDREATAAAMKALTGVTHLVYAALFEKPGLIEGWWADDQIATNDQMFRNLIDALSESARSLRHVTLLQGTKAYGVRRPIPFPATEDRDEAHDEPNFYWRHETHLRALRASASWRFTILRPQIVYGLSVGAAMNLIPVLGVYGAILKARGEKLHFPGKPSGLVQEAVDADLLASVIAWAGVSEKAQDQIFNVTNGDAYHWRSVWSDIAAGLGMEEGEERPTGFAASADGWAAEWDALRARYGLVSPGVRAFCGESLHYADMLINLGSEAPPAGGPAFGVRTPPLVSTVKLRQAGFHETMHTRAMFVKWLGELQRRRLIPPPA